MMPRPWYSRFAVFLLLSIPLLALGGRVLPYFTEGAIEIYNAPSVYSRRAHAFTLNVTGRLGTGSDRIEYRLNDGPWQPYGFLQPYADSPFFTIQIPQTQVASGKNRLNLRTWGLLGNEHNQELTFSCDMHMPVLPIVHDWSQGELEVAHGAWERVRVADGWVTRVKPGTEGYDRILVLAGAFPGARRIETRVHFNETSARGMHYGFGVLPLWGGRPDKENQVPRRGWIFSLAWYYSHRLGVGQEFSTKQGDGEPDWLGSYRNFEMHKGTWHNIIVEVWRERDAEGGFVCWNQRMKWWQDGEPEPVAWRSLSDSLPIPLGDQEYGVGFVVHRCSVDLATTKILPISENVRSGK